MSDEATPAGSQDVRVLCSRCDAVLAANLTRRSEATLRRDATGEPTISAGSLVIDPEPVVVWEVERGGIAREVEQAAAGSIVVRPDDVLDGAVSVTGVSVGCCGPDGQDGPNQACASCDQVVGTRWEDCWTQHEVRFDPAAVRLAP